MSGNSYDDEPNDDDYDYPEDVPDEFDTSAEPELNFGYGAADTARPNFERQELEFFRYVSASQYKPGIESYITNLPITQRYKEALITAVNALFTSEVAYANNSTFRTSPFGSNRDPIKTKMLSNKIALYQTIASASKDDTYVVNHKLLTDLIYGVYADYASRSIGPKRERLILTNMMNTSVMMNEQAQIEETNFTPKKKSFWSFGGFKSK